MTDNRLYEIKITGMGTCEDIISSLLVIGSTISIKPMQEIDGTEWEDRTLHAEINELETSRGKIF